MCRHCNVVRFLEKRFSDAKDGQKVIRLPGAPLDLPKIRRNPLIEILAISTGCLNACTYCKTKHARGALTSYSIGQLVERAQSAFAGRLVFFVAPNGVKEIWLTSEDLGAYGRDLPRIQSSQPGFKTHSCSFSESSPLSVPLCPLLASRWPRHLTLADLLAQLVRVIPAGCMLRLGMTNPPYILDQLTEIAEVLRHPRVYSFLHVPVQSGKYV
ncbi:unnamed protein product [Protopolystoma xenopodis]|uniref:Radical SAM core domain-containing protein n=1 Tax=Protopolystoma xenopodis TaxID=117903 RepID=A0A448WM62_9PLAT|nr:unnamed protein product [Protopolystoma xenopodis]